MYPACCAGLGRKVPALIDLVDSARHWVQQEQPEAVSELLVQFQRDYAKA